MMPEPEPVWFCWYCGARLENYDANAKHLWAAHGIGLQTGERWTITPPGLGGRGETGG